MKTSKRFKDFKLIQKSGLMIMVLGALVILAETFQILPEIEYLRDDLSNYLYLLGAFLILLPTIGTRLKNHKAKTKDFQKPAVKALIKEAIALAQGECDEPKMNQELIISKIKA